MVRGKRKRSFKATTSEKKFKGRPRAAANRSAAIERKFVDIPTTTILFSTTAQFVLLNGVQAGASQVNRIGKRINMKSLLFRGSITHEANAIGGTNDFLRWMIVYDRQTNGAVFTITQLLENTDNAGGSSTTPRSAINSEQEDRFMILHDSKHQCAASLTGAAEQVIENAGKDFCFSKVVKMKDLITNYDGTANPATVAQIVNGSLYVVTLGALAAANSSFRLTFETRLRFAD